MHADLPLLWSLLWAWWDFVCHCSNPRLWDRMQRGAGARTDHSRKRHHTDPHSLAFSCLLMIKTETVHYTSFVVPLSVFMDAFGLIKNLCFKSVYCLQFLGPIHLKKKEKQRKKERERAN